MDKLIKKLEDGMDNCFHTTRVKDYDKTSWKDRIGILISHNEAKQILEILKKEQDVQELIEKVNKIMEDVEFDKDDFMKNIKNDKV